MLQQNFSLKDAKRARRARIAELQEVGDAERAALLSDCKKGARCRSIDCPVCNRVKTRKIQRVSRRTESWTGSGFTMQMPIADISVDLRGRRALDPEKLQFIAASMGDIGQLVPVTVRVARKKQVLVSGLHRLEAAKLLGWTRILVDVVVSELEHARKEQIQENLARADLRVLDKAEHIAELFSLFVQSKDAQTAQPGGAQPADKHLSKFARHAGIHRDAVRRALLIASLTPKSKSQARTLKLDDHQATLLLAAVEADAARQLQVISKEARRIASGNARPNPSELPLDADELSIQVEAGAKAIKKMSRDLRNATALHDYRKRQLEVAEVIGGPNKNSRSEVQNADTSKTDGRNPLAEVTGIWNAMLAEVWCYVEPIGRDAFIDLIRAAEIKELPVDSATWDGATDLTDAHSDRLPAPGTHRYPLLRSRMSSSE